MWAVRAGAVCSIAIAAVATIVVLAGGDRQTMALRRLDSQSLPPAELLPAESSLAPVRTVVHEPRLSSCAPIVDDAVFGDEAVVARHWRDVHPCESLPHCNYQPPVVRLVADVDPSPGVERVIASRRFGVAMTTPTGELLGFYDTSCGSWGIGDRLELTARDFTGGSHKQLTVRQRTLAHCGEFLDLAVLRRTGYELLPILEIDEGGSRGCNVWQGAQRTRIEVRPGAVDVHYAGWHQEATEGTGWEYGPKSYSTGVCRMRLAADGTFERIDAGRKDLDPPGDHGCD